MKNYFIPWGSRLKPLASFAIATTLSAFSLTLFGTHPAQSATFKYTTAVGETIYTEDSTNANGTNYDGTFVNSIFDPFSQTFREFSGFFVVNRGLLGGAVAVDAIQTSPVDRIALGESGIARSEYFSS